MPAMAAPFEILEHPSDVGFIARGGTLAELFTNAAVALASLGCELDAVREREERAIEAAGSDTESLLYAWLAEILAVSDADRMVFCRFEVLELGAGRVRGIAHGERFDPARHRASTYIKAVTLHQFRVEQTPEGWSARVYLDV
jgi:SHS2 domain-containing protein